MKKTRIFVGSGAAVITPFANDEIDFASFRKIIDFQIENYTKAIIVCGTTGESAALSDYEHKKLISFAIEYVNGRVPVIAGTGSNSTARSLEMSRFAANEGADALLVVTPYYNKTTQPGLVAHYFKIAETSGKPLMVYNVPSRTGLNILPETYALLGEHENIVAVKEANGNIAALAESLAACAGSLDFYSGNDGEIVPFLALGGMGVVSVMANILPKQTSNICELFFSGKIEESRKLQLSLTEICSALFCETNPIPVKHAMKLMGYCNGELRLPLIEIGEKHRGRLETAMRNAGIKI